MKKVIGCLLLSGMFLLQGCGGKMPETANPSPGSETEKSAEDILRDTPKELEMQRGERYHISIDGPVNVPDIEKVYAVTTEINPWVDEVYAEVLFDDTANKEEITGSGLYDSIDTYPRQNLKFTDKEGTELYASTYGFLTYRTEVGKLQNEFVNLAASELWGSALIPLDEQKELSFMTQQKAEELVKEKLKAMGLPEINYIKVGSMSCERLNRLYPENKAAIDSHNAYLKEMGKDVADVEHVWTQDEEFYMLQGYFDYQGMSCVEWSYTHQVKEESMEPSSFIAYVNKDGLQWLDIDVACMEKSAVEITKILSLEDAVEKLDEYCSKIIGMEFNSNQVNFRYVLVPIANTVLGRELRPCWCFDHSEYYGGYAVDAETGEIYG